MMEPAAGHRGVPLSVKLILTTGVLLALVVGVSALFSHRTISQLAERNARARRADGEKAMATQAEVLARNAAKSASLPLAEGNFTYINDIVATTIREDKRIQWLVVADGSTNRIVARSPAAPSGDTLADALSAQVLAAPPGTVVSTRSGTRFTFGTRILVGDRTVGQLRMEVSTADLEAELAGAITAAEAEARRALRALLLVAGLVLLSGILVGLWQSMRITRPVKELSFQAERIAGGDLDHRVPVRTHDEIGRLAANFNYMADQIVALLAETASRASLEREMSLARTVQQAMLPARTLTERGPFRFIGYCEPATTCGGDWWMARDLGNDRLLIVIGDVTGHGIPSAMIAATARGAVEAVIRLDAGVLSPAQVLRSIDGAIRDVQGEQKLLMTCFAALIDARRGVMEYANAGHNFPYVGGVDPSGAIGDMHVLALRSSPLGHTGDELQVGSGQRVLSPGDVFVCFTDGVVDRVDPSGARFGDRRLRGLINGRVVGRDAVGLAALRDDILAHLETFAAGTPADDDVTLVVCQYAPAASAARARVAG